MRIFEPIKPRFLRLKNYFCVCLAVCFLFLFTACQSNVDYFTYVSELRSNIFRVETDDFSLRIFAMEKEYPYATDGVAREKSARTEIYLVAPSGDKTCSIAFTVNNQEYGGEMSYDNVKAEYYYSCSLEISALTFIDCTLTYGESVSTFHVPSVKTETTISPQTALGLLQTAETELFNSLTDKYGFAGEIYLRLIYEESPYYYIGVIDRNGNTTAFLLNAETGKILAKRQS